MSEPASCVVAGIALVPKGRPFSRLSLLASPSCQWVLLVSQRWCWGNLGQVRTARADPCHQGRVGLPSARESYRQFPSSAAMLVQKLNPTQLVPGLFSGLTCQRHEAGVSYGPQPRFLTGFSLKINASLDNDTYQLFFRRNYFLLCVDWCVTSIILSLVLSTC